MPLIEIWRSAPDSVRKLTIEQVVANAGDGNLRDGSPSSRELREYFEQTATSQLAEYANHCLSEGFTKSGLVLQDIVNELGRRLEYRVEPGLYQGKAREIGHDGLWKSPEGNQLIVEVKTSDAYRINLDTLAQYRLRLIDQGRATTQSSILLIVGREDTGDVEAQVRGSRHAWDIRLISIDALLKLVGLKESSGEEETAQKIRSLLVPFEYTRLDNIIDVVFSAAKDAETASEISNPIDEASADPDVAVVPRGQVRTEREMIDAKRAQIVDALSRREKSALVARSRALYWNADRTVRAACSISKRHPRTATYWYAYHPAWDTFLGDAKSAFFVLGCSDRDVAFAIPYSVIHGSLNKLRETVRDGDRKRSYWHIHILDRGKDRYALLLPDTKNTLDLAPHTLSVAAK